MAKAYEVHYEETGISSPRQHEKKIAIFLTEYFKSDIIFMRRGISKTPDLYILKRTKMRDATGISRAKEFLRTERSGIKRLKIITKERTAIDIK